MTDDYLLCSFGGDDAVGGWIGGGGKRRIASICDNAGRSIVLLPALLILSRGQTFSRRISGWYDNMKGVMNWGGHNMDGGD
eukprot:scaffold33512_cov113-Skeletonema_dohrnii-CCMP3373.AAC.4